MPEVAGKERLQKTLARSGVASRRAAEDLIVAGRVSVNGCVVTRLGTQVGPADIVALDGQRIAQAEPHVHVLLNKPRGYVTTSHDPQGRRTVLDLVAGHRPAVRGRAPLGDPAGAQPAEGLRVYPVGRLDADSEGLLLLTNDGDLAYRLTHPRFALEKEYWVLVQPGPSAQALQSLRQGIELDGRTTAQAQVEVVSGAPTPTAVGGDTWLRILIHEGRNRQVRRMCLAVDCQVRRLVRVRVGSLQLGHLPTGDWRYLTPQEVSSLRTLTQAVAPSDRCREAPPNRGAAASAAAQPLSGRPVPWDDPQGVRSPLKPSTITIDGPAAAGKSALGERLAEHLGYLYFDTGVLYRAVAWLALRRGIPVEDEVALAQLAGEATIAVTKPTVTDGRQYTVTVEDRDVTWEIRGIDVERIVSPVAAVAGVRQALKQRQRDIGLAGHVVLVGRDIGTVVLPEADLKIYLTASPEERARRRYVETVARGDSADPAALLASILERDRTDSQRAVAPLKPAPDAIVIDTDKLTIEQELDIIYALLRE